MASARATVERDLIGPYLQRCALVCEHAAGHLGRVAGVEAAFGVDDGQPRPCFPPGPVAAHRRRPPGHKRISAVVFPAPVVPTITIGNAGRTQTLPARRLVIEQTIPVQPVPGSWR